MFCAASSAIRFSIQAFPVDSSTVPYNIALTGQNKKEIVCAQNQKILPTMMDETDIDNGGRPGAVVNEVMNEKSPYCFNA